MIDVLFYSLFAITGVFSFILSKNVSFYRKQCVENGEEFAKKVVRVINLCSIPLLLIGLIGLGVTFWTS